MLNHDVPAFAPNYFIFYILSEATRAIYKRKSFEFLARYIQKR